MAGFWSIIATAHVLIAIAATLSILRRRTEPVSMLAWIFAVWSLPWLGVTFYILMGSNRVRRKAGKRRRKRADLIERIGRQAEEGVRLGVDATSLHLDPGEKEIERLGWRLVHMPAVGGNEVRYFKSAADTYYGLEMAIRAARHHVHMEYYIWQPDESGRHFRDLIVDAARRGVQCRVLLDSVGCFKLSRKFLKPWYDAGVQVAFFLPVYPFRRRRVSLHLRNHRKIAVIDGDTAFVGSQNIGDEYLGRLKRLSPWYDSHMRITGPAALFLQQVFAEDWAFTTYEGLADAAYFPPCGVCGDSAVQLLPTGPDQDLGVLGQILFAAVASAKSSIRIATAYFVPDSALRGALMHAALRGVKVQLVLPTRSDSLLVLWAGRSYYAELMEAGIEIFEFEQGMLHSKMITIDDRWAMLGSANMDVRSFRLNFEVSALIYDAQVARVLAAEIEQHRAASREVKPRDVWRRKYHEQVLEGAARLFAPVL